MRLDKIMIWISIHLHSLAWSISPSVTTRSPTRSLLLPFRISQSYARYHTNALFVPVAVATALISLPSKCDTDGQATSSRSTRCDAIGGRGRERGRLRISRDRSANESSVYSLRFFIIFLFERTCARYESAAW